MRSPSKYIYWTVGVGIVVTLAWRDIASDERPSLPNGAKFRLYEVTHGTTHTVWLGTTWERIKNWRVIRAGLKAIGKGPPGLRSQSTFTSQPSTVFWVEHTGSGTDFSLEPADWRAEVLDEREGRAKVQPPFRRYYTPVMAWKVEEGPLSGKTLTLDIHMRDPARTNEWLHVGRLRTRNPAR